MQSIRIEQASDTQKNEAWLTEVTSLLQLLLLAEKFRAGSTSQDQIE